MCKFVFDPSLWPKQVEMVDEPWKCPYPELDGFDYCIFHILPLTRKLIFETQAQIHIEQIRAVRSTGLIQIICASLRSVDLSILSKAVMENTQIQIGYSTIHGEINASESTFDNYVAIEDCRINLFESNYSVYNSALRIQNSFIADLELSETAINRRATFIDTTFGESRFIDACFNDTLSFCEGVPDRAPLSEVDDFLGKRACEFLTTPLFMGAQFSDGAIFNGVEFQSGGNFNHSEFNGGCSFEDARFQIGCHFGFAEFYEETAFIGAQLGTANFEKTNFHGPVIFDRASIGSGRTYSNSSNAQNHAFFEGISPNEVDQTNNLLNDYIFDNGIVSVAGKAASFDNAQSEDLMKARKVHSKGMITAFNSHFYFLNLDLKFDSSSPTISFYDSEIESGIVRISDKESFYEWVNTTVGDISIVSSIDRNPFKNILIENTRFNGFEFSNYRELLEDLNWNIDGYFHEAEQKRSDRRETTYSKAKSGAEQVGDYYAESQFFIKEQKSRRARHKRKTKNADTVREFATNLGKYSSNLFYDISCRYAESPKRVFHWSVVSVLSFSFIYWCLDIPLSELEYLTFSLQSFTSFIPGNGLKTLPPLARFVTSIQSFTGTFLIALFVATMIRTVKR